MYEDCSGAWVKYVDAVDALKVSERKHDIDLKLTKIKVKKQFETKLLILFWVLVLLLISNLITISLLNSENDTLKPIKQPAGYYNCSKIFLNY